ncbi:hypothetical protein PGT21_001078, partial [Puccinia graminis f. sp. tritici]
TAFFQKLHYLPSSAEVFPHSTAAQVHQRHLNTINSFFLATMVFVRYNRQVKVIVVNMARRGVPLDQINKTIDCSVLPDSLSRWMHIYNNTWDVLRDPMTYEQRDIPWLFHLKRQNS